MEVGGTIRLKHVTHLMNGVISVRQIDDQVQVRILNDASVGAVATMSVYEATEVGKLLMKVIDAIDPIEEPVEDDHP
jgi:hypothetical protein